MARSVYIRTLGCPKNETDSEHLRGLLQRAGYTTAASPESADVVLVNTCSFIEAARRESVDAVLDELAARRDGQAVVVSGCLVERYGAELERELPEVDAFLNLGAYGRAVDVIDRALGGVRTVCSDPGKVPIELGTPAAPESPTAYVKISEGCDRVCSFCAIPQIRGPHRSRTMQAVEDEVRWLVEHGTKEVVLVAQDMSLYGRDAGGRWLLPQLIRRLGRVDGLLWLRTLYHYPRFVNTALLDAVEASEPAVPYFDLSLQHASRKLVGKMRRWGDGERFLDLIGTIRDRFPDAALRSAFIVGFPGETEDDAAELAEFLPKAQLDWAGFFHYSREEGTEAGAFIRRRVRREVVERRVEALGTIQAEVADARRAALVGSTVEVLVERREASTIVGRTWREAPEVDAEVRIAGLRGARVGDVVRVRVTATDGLDLQAAVA